MRDDFKKMTATEILGEVFARLDILAKAELDKAEELLGIAKEVSAYTTIANGDLDALSGLTRKALHRQRVGYAYRWAKQDIRAYLGIEVTDEEFSEAVKNHPTERA